MQSEAKIGTAVKVSAAHWLGVVYQDEGSPWRAAFRQGGPGNTWYSLDKPGATEEYLTHVLVAESKRVADKHDTLPVISEGSGSLEDFLESGFLSGRSEAERSGTEPS